MNIVKLIDNADECNINQFIRAAFKNDLSVLIISGNPSPKQLAQAFENILIDFNDIAGQSVPSEQETLMRQIKMMEARIEAMDKYIFTDEQSIKLVGRPFDDFSLYHKYGYQISFNGDKNDFLRQLNDVKTAELTYRVDLQDLYDEFDKLKKADNTVNSTATEIGFLKQIKNIELFYKIQLDFDKYSVKRLAILIGDYREMVDRNSMN